MSLKLLQIDAFADGPFTGNPAAVIPLETPLDEESMQRIAAENNLSETAFTVPIPNTEHQFALRWFTPTVEVELCGHATLAAVAALRDLGEIDGAVDVTFSTRSGPLVGRFLDSGDIEIDLPVAPSDRPVGSDLRDAVERALDVAVSAVFADRYALAVLTDENDVRQLVPSEAMLRAIGLPLIATSASSEPGVDFVSRFFAPTLGVYEDPVTGSAHCQLTPYWASVLGKRRLVARQVSKRGGRLSCTLDGARVRLAGGAHVYLRGTIDVGLGEQATSQNPVT